MRSLCRRYTETDRDALHAVIDASCVATPYMATRRFEPTADWQHALATPDCSCHLLLLATDDAAPVGWCRLFTGADSCSAELGIGLLPAYWGQGRGPHLVTVAQEWAQSRGLTHVHLTVHPANRRALRCFDKCGFLVNKPSSPDLLTMMWSCNGTATSVRIFEEARSVYGCHSQAVAIGPDSAQRTRLRLPG